jgi:hypothetical protein
MIRYLFTKQIDMIIIPPENKKGDMKLWFKKCTVVLVL